MINKNINYCSKCLYDETYPNIKFDNKNICNYCDQIEELKKTYGTGVEKGITKFKSIVTEIKKNKKKSSKYDCVIGVSGGTDSSYLLYIAVKYGLKPLAVHYDNTWNTAIASSNIRKVLDALNIDLYTWVISNKESEDLLRSFFLASVSEIEAPTDLAIAEVLYRAADKYKIKYILEGHSFVTEGITPLTNNYFDGKYIQDIHQKFGSLKKLHTYPLMTLTKFLKWSCISRIKRIRPFWYLDYSKNEAMEILKKKFDWKYYSGHHLENRSASFYHSVYLPTKFAADYRINTIAAKVREKEILRDEGLKLMSEPLYIEKNLVNYFIKRLKLSKIQYKDIMEQKKRYWYEFKTYKKFFENFSFIFYFLVKKNLIPESFYKKYCKKVK
jgi:N-acetyl sugar amidotransferase